VHDQAKDLRQLARQETQLATGNRSARPKVVMLAAGKGGVGTTTLAVNLSVALAKSKRRTMLIDTDPNGGDVAVLCQLEERYTLADVLLTRKSLPEVLQPGPGGIDVLPGNRASASLDDCLASVGPRLIGPLEKLGTRFDLVIVDVGNRANRIAKHFRQAADLILLVTDTELPSVMGAYGAIKVLAAGDHAPRVQSLVNRSPNPGAGIDVHARLARACRRLIGINLTSAGQVASEPQMPASVRTGQPLVLAAPECRAARQIRRVARSVAAFAGISRRPASVRGGRHLSSTETTPSLTA